MFKKKKISADLPINHIIKSHLDANLANEFPRKALTADPNKDEDLSPNKNKKRSKFQLADLDPNVDNECPRKALTERNNDEDESPCRRQKRG